jgi:hypothetical protein
LHGQARRGLVAHARDHLGTRADGGDPASRAGVRQLRVLGQESVARMHGITAGGNGEIDDLVHVQVAGKRVIA